MTASARAASGRLPARPAAGLGTQDLAMLAVCLIWGANFTVSKLALRAIPPLGFTALRFLSASLALWWVVRRREGGLQVPAGALPKLVWLGVVGNTLYQLGFILGLSRTTASNSALLLAAVPSAVAVLGGVLGLERTTRRMRWGVAVGTLGVVLVVAARGLSFGGGTLVGDLLTVGAVLCWSLYTIGLRTLPAEISPLKVTMWVTLTGTPGLVLAGLPDLLRLDWAAVPAGAWLALTYSWALSLVVAYLLWNASVRAVGSNRTAIYMCVTPVVAVGVAWLVLGETPRPLQGVGAAMIVAGVLLSRRAPAPEG